MEMYNKINSLIKEKQITKKHMCSDLNISYNSLMSMFNRKSKSISLSTIQSIADYFDVTIDYLIRDEITDKNYGKEIYLDTKKEHHPKKEDALEVFNELVRIGIIDLNEELEPQLQIFLKFIESNKDFISMLKDKNK